MVYHAASHCSCRVLQVSVETGEADIKIFEGEKVFPKVATERERKGDLIFKYIESCFNKKRNFHRMEVIRAILSNKIAANYDKRQIRGKGDGAEIQN